MFDGATIGQVFTGHVDMTCPIAADRQQQAKDDDRRRAGSAPLATALLTIAIWQAWLALPTGGSTPSTHALHALLFLAGGAGARYVTPRAVVSWGLRLVTFLAEVAGAPKKSSL